MQENLDVERMILLKMSDKDLISACHLNSQNLQKVCSEQFFHRILQERYPDTVDLDYGFEGQDKWKYQYLTVVKWVAELKETYDYTYTDGDPRIQFKILLPFMNGRMGKPGIVKYIQAASYGQLGLLKYLQPENINDYPSSLHSAALNGHLNVVKYLVEEGVEDSNSVSFINAAKEGHLDVVKYLIRKGAVNSKEVLRQAREMAGKHPEVVQYLQTTENMYNRGP